MEITTKDAAVKMFNNQDGFRKESEKMLGKSFDSMTKKERVFSATMLAAASSLGVKFDK